MTKQMTDKEMDAYIKATKKTSKVITLIGALIYLAFQLTRVLVWAALCKWAWGYLF